MARAGELRRMTVRGGKRAKSASRRHGAGPSGLLRGPGLLLALVAGLAACGEPEPGLPHVVFLLADDIGYADLQPYRRARRLSEPYPTPNVDRLAREGMMFLDAHQPASVCAPARFAMLTGSNPGRGRPAWGMNVPSAFDEGGETRHRGIGEVMQAAGYRTAFVGKEHTGGRGLDAEGRLTADLDRLDPGRTVEIEVLRGDGARVRRVVSRPRGLVAHGFDATYTLAGGIQSPPYLFWRDDRFSPIDPSMPRTREALRRFAPLETIPGDNGEGMVLAPGIGDRRWNTSQVGIQLASEASRILEDHLRRHEEPLLLFYASQAAHVPHTPPIDFDGDPDPIDEPVRGAALSRKTDMVVDFDRQVGRILDAIDAAGAARDTLVFVSSDNGGHLGGMGDQEGKQAERAAGYASSWPFRGSKDTPWEGGHRVPLIVRWGDGTPEGSRIAPGTRTRQLVAVQDWVATLYALTGQALPDDQALDAVSLLPLLLSADPDREPPVRTRLLFREYDRLKPLGFGVRQDERDAGGRLLHQWYFFEGGGGRLGDRLFLYDLRRDPTQENDLLRGVRAGVDPAELTPKAGLRLLAQRERVEAMRRWALAHLGPDDPPSTPRGDDVDPRNRTPRD